MPRCVAVRTRRSRSYLTFPYGKRSVPVSNLTIAEPRPGVPPLLRPGARVASDLMLQTHMLNFFFTTEPTVLEQHARHEEVS